jgi:hypothetical protein
MNTDTDYMIKTLRSLLKERETESVFSQNYAKITVDIMWLEKALSKRNVDLRKIFEDFFASQG